MNFYRFKIEFYPYNEVEKTDTCVGIVAAKSLSNAIDVTIKAFCKESDVENIEVAPFGPADESGVLYLANEEAIKNLADSMIY